MSTLRKSLTGAFLAINTLTAVNGGIIAHDFIHNDIMTDPYNDEKLLIAFSNATIGSIVALAYPAIDWQSGANPSFASDGDTPLSIIAENTPDALRIPGGVLSIVGAPGSSVGNFIGSVTGYFDPT